MPDSDEFKEQPGDTRGRRLRVDPDKVEAARQFLARLTRPFSPPATNTPMRPTIIS